MKWALSVRARLDIRIILSVSGDRFGPDAQRRYRLLLAKAIDDVAADPGRAGVRQADAQADILLYHARHARPRTPPGQSVSRPRHVLIFRIVGDEIRILRVLHDAMDLPSRLVDL